ncbi:hypothetical protein N7462_000652 [Penicillium macrosclerotiorum]|uniref:uncharacterized protein n=1 Tax=Penicillium macrosclerotiorum TaxID=303699 RepID=UPI002549642D|nr:uncharacterized protein N7462_000652 [Penicillium macrosclerotiorum]KAJ5698647.1 hypothetical protein N7462_000652 [Penicillium macrosclerotiorum]
MPITKTDTLPSSATQLNLPNDTGAKTFIAFVSSKDPVTGLPWCPDVRAALPFINAAFESDSAPSLAVVEVGQKEVWRHPQNEYRVNWNVTAIPALVRYERVNGHVSETGRLVEGQILDKDGLAKFIS